MKFLCDNCKAKYQIADEKVAGRTVRMKCRKCGHLIEVRASVTETSVAKSAPAAEVSTTDLASVVEKAPVAPVGQSPKAPTAGAPKKPAAPAPKPATSPLRVAGGAASPAAGRASAPKPAPRPAGGLAGAFEKVVKEDDKPIADEPTRMLDLRGASLDMTSPASTEEWYVGVNGVPVGPVRLAELRQKAAGGAITEDSLVWREGFEEWLPLRTFPELVDLVRSAQGTERLSATPPPPSAKGGLSSASPPSKRSAPPPRGASGATVIPFSRAATAEKIEEKPAEQPAALADPFAHPAPLAAVAPAPSAGDFAAPMAPAAVAAPAIASERPPPRRSGAIPPMAWVAIVLAMATGVVAGSVIFTKAPPPPTVQIVTVAAPQAAAPTGTATGSSAEPATSAVEITPDQGSTAQRVPGHVAVNTAPKKDDTGPVGTVPTIPAIGGPSLVGPGPAGPTPGGTADRLTSADLERVINNGRASLKRACWEPALAAKSPSAPSTARVAVAITIGPEGRVQSAVPSGGDSFPSLGPCIAARIRNWIFPQASTSTSTTAAFNFVAQ